MPHKIGHMASENQQLCSVNQELVDEKELLAINRQHLQAVHGHLDLALARLDRYTDQLEMVNQRRADQISTVHSLLRMLPSSRVTDSTIQSESWSTNRSRSFGLRYPRRVRVNRQTLGRWEMSRASYGKLSSVRSGDTVMNSHTFAISFRAVPAQDMGLCIQCWLIFRLFRLRRNARGEDFRGCAQ
jgi:hypothetical protein